VYRSPSELTNPLDRATESAGLQTHPFPDPEGPGAEQHHAGRSHCRVSAAPRDRRTTAVNAPPTASDCNDVTGDAEGKDQARSPSSAAGSGNRTSRRWRIHPAHERRTDEAADRTRQAPAECDDGDHGQDPDRAWPASSRSIYAGVRVTGSPVGRSPRHGWRRAGCWDPTSMAIRTMKNPSALALSPLPCFSLTSNDSPTFAQASLGSRTYGRDLRSFRRGLSASAWLLEGLGCGRSYWCSPSGGLTST